MLCPTDLKGDFVCDESTESRLVKMQFRRNVSLLLFLLQDSLQASQRCKFKGKAEWRMAYSDELDYVWMLQTAQHRNLCKELIKIQFSESQHPSN